MSVHRPVSADVPGAEDQGSLALMVVDASVAGGTPEPRAVIYREDLQRLGWRVVIPDETLGGECAIVYISATGGERVYVLDTRRHGPLTPR